MSKIIWNKLANDYEKKVLSLTKVPERRKQILSEIKKGEILNLGTGSATRLNQDLIKAGNKVTAVDFSKKMLEIAVNSFSHPDLKYKFADGRRLPFKNNTFDSVVSVNSILPEKRKDVSAMIQEIYRALKSSGKFIAFLPSYETVKESMKVYNTNLRIDDKELRVYDSSQWQCFHARATIKKIIGENGFKKYKIKKVFQNTIEEIKQIKRIYGIDISKRPSYHHFLVALK